MRVHVVEIVAPACVAENLPALGDSLSREAFFRGPATGREVEGRNHRCAS